MAHLKTYCEVTIDTGEVDDEGEAIYTKDYFWLLYWGLKYDIVDNRAVNFTVAICENCKTGQIICVMPENIKILGNEIKE